MQTESGTSLYPHAWELTRIRNTVLAAKIDLASQLRCLVGCLHKHRGDTREEGIIRKSGQVFVCEYHELHIVVSM